VLCGVLLGVYFTILHALFFMHPAYVWGFSLIVYIAVVFPIVAWIWDASKLRSVMKKQLFFFGVSLVSVVFTVVYLGEFFLFSLFVDSFYSYVSSFPMFSFLSS
jgi:hypothetical protein